MVLTQKNSSPLRIKTAAKRQFGLGNEPCVLFVGSLIPRKGLPFLVEAAKKIVKEQSETKFLIVGEGPLRSQLAKSIEAANLSGNFKFLGNLKDESFQPRIIAQTCLFCRRFRRGRA